MSDLQETCPWCGGLAQDIGNGIAAHACPIINKEIRMPIAAWNHRVKAETEVDSYKTERTSKDARKAFEELDLWTARNLPREAYVYPLTFEDIRKLYYLCDDHLRTDCLQFAMSMHPNLKSEETNNGYISAAFMMVNANYFKKREAISFNHDGFIGFSGWASTDNTRPFINAFFDWLEWLKKEYLNE